MVAIETAGPAAEYAPHETVDGGASVGLPPAPVVDNQTLYLVVMPQGIDPAGGNVVGEHTPDYAYPHSGVQFTGMLAANETRRWFTYNWREWHRVEWWMLPTMIGSGSAQLRWDVALERASGSRVTYWLTVTNLTAAPLTFDGRYTVLGRSA